MKISSCWDTSAALPVRSSRHKMGFFFFSLLFSIKQKCERLVASNVLWPFVPARNVRGCSALDNSHRDTWRVAAAKKHVTVWWSSARAAQWRLALEALGRKTCRLHPSEEKLFVVGANWSGAATDESHAHTKPDSTQTKRALARQYDLSCGLAGDYLVLQGSDMKASDECKYCITSSSSNSGSRSRRRPSSSSSSCFGLKSSCIVRAKKGGWTFFKRRKEVRIRKQRQCCSE